jgi:hypothetical protein
VLIYIPSRSRADWVERRGTLRYLEPHVQQQVIFVVPSLEHHAYLEAIGHLVREVVASISASETIAEVRHSIGVDARERGADKFVMLDDDLTFLVRRDAETHHQRMAVPSDVTEALAAIDHCLDSYASVGLSAREANGLRDGMVGPKPALKEFYRIMRVAGFRTADFLSVEHCRVPVMEDHDVQLQLLRSGRKNALLYWWASGQTRTGNPGGCSIYRTLEVHNAAARRLAELHPGLVTVRASHVTGKERKTGGGDMAARLETTIQWRRAYRRDGWLRGA